MNGSAPVAVAETESGALKIAVPALILQDRDDTTVFPSATDRLAVRGGGVRAGLRRPAACRSTVR